MENPTTGKTSLWVVNRTEESDGLYLFEDWEQAKEFASLYSDAVLTEEPIFDLEAGEQLLSTAKDESAI